MTAKNDQQVTIDATELAAMRQLLVDLQAQVTAAQARPAQRTAGGAGRIVVDGVTLANRPDKAEPQKRLTSASIVNISAMMGLRLKAMGVEGVTATLVSATPPYIETTDDAGNKRQFGITRGVIDATDYYFNEYH